MGSKCCSGAYPEDKSLNDFIKNDAIQQQEEGWNVTYVALEPSNKKIVGYVTILEDTINIAPEIQKEYEKDYLVA